MQKLSLTFAIAIDVPRAEKSIQIDQTKKYDELSSYFSPLITHRQMTDAERQKILRELVFTYGEEITQSLCESSNIELSQGTKPIEQTPVNSSASPKVEDIETKILNDTCDEPIITSGILNQDGDVTNDVDYRTVSPVVENSETQTLHDTCDTPIITSISLHQDDDVTYSKVSPVAGNSETKILSDTCINPVIKNYDGNIAKEAKSKLDSGTNSGQHLDFSRKSSTRFSTHTRKQRKSTPKSNRLKTTYRTLIRKIGKPQTKQKVHQNSTTRLLTFFCTPNTNYNSPSNRILFLSRLLLKRPKVKIKYK